MKNEKLHTKLKEWTEAVWKQLSVPFIAERLSMIAHLPPGFRLPLPENSAHFLSRFQSVECVRLILASLLNTNTEKELLDIVEEDAQISRHLNTPLVIAGNTVTLTSRECIIKWIGKFIYDYQTTNYSNKLFDLFYTMTEEEFYKDTFTFQQVYGVCFLHTEDDEVEFDAGIKIRKLSQKERGMNHENIGFLTMMTSHTISGYGDIPKGFNTLSVVSDQVQPIIDTRERLNDFCSALRLFKSGHIGIVYTTQEYPYWVPAIDTSSTSHPPTPFPGPTYSISRKEAQDINVFWKKYLSYRSHSGSFNPSNDKLQTAIELFNSFFSEQSEKARFLSLIMALETLTETRYKPEIVQELIDEWKTQVSSKKAQLDAHSDDYAALESLERELLFRKEVSIRKQIRELVLETLTIAGYSDGQEIARQALKVYDKRSILVHEGKLSPKELSLVTEKTKSIVEIILRAKLNIVL